MKIKKSFLLAASIIFCFCNWGKDPKAIKKAAWLIGTWEGQTQKGNIYETWTKTSDDELAGKSYMLKGKDTIVFETIKLQQVRDSLFYIPTVKQQNGGLPVKFGAKLVSDRQLVFENLSHDFPQVVTYTKAGVDSLTAEISGMKSGQLRKQTFPMKRIK